MKQKSKGVYRNHLKMMKRWSFKEGVALGIIAGGLVASATFCLGHLLANY